jgi:hypothetical protein
MHRYGAIALVFFALDFASPAAAQPAGMSADEQAWFSCMISRRWCVVASTNSAPGNDRMIAMVSAKNPARVHGRVSRITLQIACSGEKPQVMLMTGLEIDAKELTLNYRIEPSGAGSLVAKHASAGHFFELSDPDFLRQLKTANAASIDLVVPDDGDRGGSRLDFDLRDGAAALKQLSCVPY